MTSVSAAAPVAVAAEVLLISLWKQNGLFIESLQQQAESALHLLQDPVAQKLHQ